MVKERNQVKSAKVTGSSASRGGDARYSADLEGPATERPTTKLRGNSDEDGYRVEHNVSSLQRY